MRQRARRARLALDPAADIEEVAGRQLQLAGQHAACTSAAVLPRSRPVTDASTAMRRVPASRRIAAGPKVCVIVRELAERNLACRRGRR